jgi:hypothetical protein
MYEESRGIMDPTWHEAFRDMIDSTWWTAATLTDFMTSWSMIIRTCLFPTAAQARALTGLFLGWDDIRGPSWQG